MTLPMLHPGFAERWPLWCTGDGLGCGPGAAGSGALGQGDQGFLESWISGFLGSWDVRAQCGRRAPRFKVSYFSIADVQAFNRRGAADTSFATLATRTISALVQALALAKESGVDAGLT
jgi:hypothetical protein